MKEIKSLNEWRDTPSEWVEKQPSVNASQIIYRISIIPFKILACVWKFKSDYKVYSKA